MRLRRTARAEEPRTVSPSTAGARPIRAKALRGHLMLAADGLWAFYVLDDVQWNFTAHGERNALLSNMTQRWADLAGHRVHLRLTNQPVPYATWAATLDRRSPGRIADVEGAESWADYLAANQLRIAELRADDPTVYLGVRITTKRPHVSNLERLLGDDALTGDLDRIRKKLRRVTESVSKEGFGARPISSRGLAWLIHASIAPGIPVSTTSLGGPHDEWTAEDMDVFTTPTYTSCAPYDPTVQVRALRNGRQHTRHVVALSMGRFGTIDTDDPQWVPWLAYTLRFEFPIEVSAIFDVVDGRHLEARAARDRRVAEDLQAHYTEHGEKPPARVHRAIEDAARIEDEVTEGAREIAVRLVGQVRLMVAGTDEEQALSRADEIVEGYARDARTQVRHSYGQYDIVREFIPGEGRAPSGGHERVMAAYVMAAAVPNAASGLGDDDGPYFAHTNRFGRRAVRLDPQAGPRSNRSGLAFIVAEPGGGKSTAAGLICESSARRGHRTVVFDPSGPLARLCDLPALRSQAQHIELSSAHGGVLNPYRLVLDPSPTLYSAGADHAEALREADAERRDLAVDTFLNLIPPQMLSGRMDATSAIEAAVNAVGGAYGTNPWRVVDALRAGSGIGKEVATALEGVATMKGGTLIFPDQLADEDTSLGLSQATLTVLTMRGMVTPPEGMPREQWSRAERMAVPTLHLASRFAARAMYADADPKVIVTDEGGIIATGASSFRSFLLRGSRDSRKTNTFFGVLTQNPTDLDAIGPEVGNLSGMVLVGKLRSEQSAISALRLLGIPDGYGYHKTLLRLSTGEFLLSDWRGRKGVVHVDLAHRPDLLAALDTTPAAVESATNGAGAVDLRSLAERVG